MGLCTKTPPTSPSSGGAAAPCAPPSGGPPPMSQDQANALFKQLAADKDIPFNYPVDCCYTRANEMCRIMNSQGIPCGKTWYYAQGWPVVDPSNSLTPKDSAGKPVTFYSPASGGPQPVTWVYHVAPTVMVRKDDGTVQEEVLDPSLSDHPLTKDQWHAIQGSPPGATSVDTDSTPYFHDPRPGATDALDPTGDKTKDMLAKHRATRDAALAAQATPPSP